MGASTTGNEAVVTRFAPSPTGYLHIGGARTALFNWLYARHHGGRFLLRIEDTDRARSTQSAIDAILEGMRWLGLDWDGEAVFQFARAPRHAEVARELLARGAAYRCYATTAELEAMRADQKARGLPLRYDGRWRDRAPGPEQESQPFVVRLRASQEGATTIEDRVQGPVTVNNAELDDMVLLRSDGTPTYMLAVVVDDHDMGVTHVVRGDDHLNNAFRQLGIIRAMAWETPVYAHIPLIHASDGAKLSKRHGALGVDAYRDALGMLPEAVDNYLLRLGWGHGDDEIIDRAQAVKWFDLDAVGRAPARFDLKKLESINGHYLREADDTRLAALVAPRLFIQPSAANAGEGGNPSRSGGEDEGLPSFSTDNEKKTLIHPSPAGAGEGNIGSDALDLLRRAMPVLKVRAKSVNELADGAAFLFRTRPLPMDEAAAKLLEGAARQYMARARDALTGTAEWGADALEAAVRVVAEQEGVGLGKIAQPLRAALTGRATSPGIFDVLALLGREESLARLSDQVDRAAAA